MQSNSLSNITLIILAAGNSSRMGSPKGLLKINNDFLINHHINNFKNLKGEKIIVTTGIHHEEYKKVIDENISIIKNNKISLGQFHSIQLALKNLKTDSAFLMPVDTHPLKEQTIMQIYKNADNYKVCVPTYNGLGGHPIFMNSDFIKSIKSISKNNQNFRLDYQIKKLNSNSLKRVEIDDSGICSNINTLKDYSEITLNNL